MSHDKTPITNCFSRINQLYHGKDATSKIVYRLDEEYISHLKTCSGNHHFILTTIASTDLRTHFRPTVRGKVDGEDGTFRLRTDVGRNRTRYQAERDINRSVPHWKCQCHWEGEKRAPSPPLNWPIADPDCPQVWGSPSELRGGSKMSANGFWPQPYQLSLRQCVLRGKKRIHLQSHHGGEESGRAVFSRDHINAKGNRVAGQTPPTFNACNKRPVHHFELVRFGPPAIG